MIKETKEMSGLLDVVSLVVEGTETELDELSTEKLGMYKKAAGAHARELDSRGEYEKANKRFSGIVKATIKQFDNDLKKYKSKPPVAEEVETELDEATNVKPISHHHEPTDITHTTHVVQRPDGWAGVVGRYENLGGGKDRGLKPSGKSVYISKTHPSKHLALKDANQMLSDLTQHMKEEVELDEKMDVAKTDMGHVITDFQQSDAPQFVGKSKEKRRQMAIASKMQADRLRKEEKEVLSYKQFVEQLLEYTPGSGGRTIVRGRSYGAQYHDPEGDDEDDGTIHRHKSDHQDSEAKRGRGRPSGSYGGAYKPRSAETKAAAAAKSAATKSANRALRKEEVELVEAKIVGSRAELAKQNDELFKGKRSPFSSPRRR